MQNLQRERDSEADRGSPKSLKDNDQESVNHVLTLGYRGMSWF